MKQRWAAALTVGYILMFFSEFLFVNVYPHFDLLGVFPMWLAYSIEAYIFLAVVEHFRVRNIWALFLAGAIYGWLLEGVVVQTMYVVFPFQIAFTGLSWHALIDVLIGWYLVRRMLFGGSPFCIFLLATLIGLFWGFWAIWVWQEHEMLSVGEFTLLAFGTALPLIPAYWQLNRLGPFHFNKSELRVLIGLHIFLFVFVEIAIPYAVLILPPLLAMIFGALRRHKNSSAPESIQMIFEGRVQNILYLPLVLIPTVAVAWYALFSALGVQIATNIIVALITVPASVVMFIVALAKLYRFPPPNVTTIQLDAQSRSV